MAHQAGRTYDNGDIDKDEVDDFVEIHVHASSRDRLLVRQRPVRYTTGYRLTGEYADAPRNAGGHSGRTCVIKPR
jgi:hypothetical protein